MQVSTKTKTKTKKKHKSILKVKLKVIHKSYYITKTKNSWQCY